MSLVHTATFSPQTFAKRSPTNNQAYFSLPFGLACPQKIKHSVQYPVDWPGVKKTKAPTSGSTVSRSSDGKVTFTWEGSDPDQGDELKYTLYVDKTDGKQSPDSDLTDISAKTADVALDAGTLYYWRVKTSDGTNSSFSTVYSFRTE